MDDSSHDVLMLVLVNKLWDFFTSLAENRCSAAIATTAAVMAACLVAVAAGVGVVVGVIARRVYKK